MSVKLTYTTALTVAEVLAANTVSAAEAQRTVTHSLLNKSAVFTGTSDVPVSKVAAFEKALVAGAGSIDLTALVGTNGAAVDGTGLKVQAIKVIADADNSAAITLADGASNGYELLGASWTIKLKAGQEIVIFGNEETPDIGGTAKVIDLTGTGTDKLQIIIVMG